MNDLYAFNSSECALHFDGLPRALVDVVISDSDVMQDFFNPAF